LNLRDRSKEDPVSHSEVDVSIQRDLKSSNVLILDSFIGGHQVKVQDSVLESDSVFLGELDGALNILGAEAGLHLQVFDTMAEGRVVSNLRERIIEMLRDSRSTVGVREHARNGILEQGVDGILMDPELLTLVQGRHIGESIVAHEFEGSHLLNTLRGDKETIHLEIDDSFVVNGRSLGHGQVKRHVLTKGSCDKGIVVSLLENVVNAGDFGVNYGRDLSELTVNDLFDDRVSPAGNSVENTASQFDVEISKGDL
jgi:hypothetical protein